MIPKKERIKYTYKCMVSLNFGLRLLFLDLVECRLLLSLKCGPRISTSTNGLNTPVKKERKKKHKKENLV